MHVLGDRVIAEHDIAALVIGITLPADRRARCQRMVWPVEQVSGHGPVIVTGETAAIGAFKDATTAGRENAVQDVPTIRRAGASLCTAIEQFGPDRGVSVIKIAITDRDGICSVGLDRHAIQRPVRALRGGISWSRPEVAELAIANCPTTCAVEVRATDPTR